MKVPRPLLRFLQKRVLAYIERYPPTRVIENRSGQTYLNRWELRGNHPIFDIYLHEFVRSDDDRALHDHPAVSASVLIRGRYVERFRSNRHRIRMEGDFIPRRASTPHRIEVDSVGPRPVTVFLRGPKLREWGFLCPEGWRHNRDFRIKGCIP